MKAFIYLKNGNAKKAEINDVVAVREDKGFQDDDLPELRGCGRWRSICFTGGRDS